MKFLVTAAGALAAHGIMSFREVSTSALDATSIEWSSASGLGICSREFQKRLDSHRKAWYNKDIIKERQNKK